MQNKETNFYGRTKGKKLSQEKETLLETLLPKLEFSIEKFTELCESKKYKKIILDIGFGQGESTFFGAKNNPNTLYIGIEIFVNGYANLLQLIHHEKTKNNKDIKNILIAPTDAVRLLRTLPDNIFDRVQLLFPDPWHKKRHNKRRFVSQNNLEEISRILKDKGIFRFVSDIDDYNFWTLMEITKRKDFKISFKNNQDYEKPPKDWAQTKYEKKAIRENRRPLFFDFKKSYNK